MQEEVSVNARGDSADVAHKAEGAAGLSQARTTTCTQAIALLSRHVFLRGSVQ